MSDQSWKAEGGTRRMGRSESSLVESDDGGDEAWDEAGLMGTRHGTRWV